MFSELVTPATAGNKANYALDNGASITSATVNGNTVTLATSVLAPFVNYTLTVNGILDFATVPNAIAANTTKSISVTAPLMYKLYTNASGTGTNDILNNAIFKSGKYDQVRFLANLEAPAGIADNYIGQIQAYVIPPTNGNYTFFISSDDAGMLYLSTDDNPANKTLIASHNYWTDSRQYTKGVADTVNQKSVPISLVAGKKYYIEALVKEGGGGDNLAVAWQLPGAAVPANGADPILGKYLQPYGYTPGTMALTDTLKSVTVAENAPATFAMAASAVQGTPDASGNYQYQWFRNNVAITDATNATYTIARASMFDNGSLITLRVSNKYSSATSSQALLTVNGDANAPTVAAAAIITNKVSVTFGQYVVTATSTNAANYSLKTSSGSSIAINSITYVDEKNVVLNTADLVTGGAYTLTVSNIKPQTFVAKVLTSVTLSVQAFNFLEYARINNTQPYSISGDGTKVTMVAGGSDIWNNADQFGYAYRQITGNFDITVHLTTLNKADNWTKAGIMARINTAAGSRHVSTIATASDGQNQIVSQMRAATDGASSSGGAGATAPKYPNVWLRLQRWGATFYQYSSTDGVNWVLYNTKDTTADGAFPDTILVGLALTSHNTGATATAIFDSFGLMTPEAITLNAVAGSTSVIEQRGTTLTATVKAGTGPMTYQWQRAAAGSSTWVNVTGATGTTLNIDRTPISNNGAKYRLAVTNPYQTVYSGEVTMTVAKDTTAPAIVSIGAFLGGNIFAVKFDEVLDTTSATNVNNYAVNFATSSVKPTLVTLRSGSTVAVLTMPSTAAAVSGVKLAINGVTDFAGNAVAATNDVTVVNMVSADIGTRDANGVFIDPVTAGITYVTSASDFETVAGGTDIYNTADAFHFVYKQVAGDFDVKVRVESVDYVTDNYAKAGLMVREDKYANSRNMHIVVEPTTGANVTEVNYREVSNGKTAAWPNSSAIGPVSYPNAWLRLVRQGDLFTALRSINGVDWEVRGKMSPAQPYPTTVLVGMATTSHNNTAGKVTTAKYHDFSIGTLALPQILGSMGSANLDKVIIAFNSRMSATTATVAANYTATSGLVINSAKLDGTGTKVVLSTSQQTPGAYYMVTISTNVTGVNGFGFTNDKRTAFTAWDTSIGFLVRDVWSGIGSPLSTLLGSPKYPYSPGSTSYLTSFEVSSGQGTNFSDKVYGFVTPSVTGDYVFYIASGGPSTLSLSTDDNEANLAVIAKVNTSTGIREWNNTAEAANQKSAVKKLEAGKMYYVEAVRAQGSGTDHLAVTWALAGSTPANGSVALQGDALIVAFNPDRLTYSTLAIVTQPQDATLLENRSAQFSVAAQVNPADTTVIYQWQKLVAGNWTSIVGANSASYVTPALKLADSGAKFRALVGTLNDTLVSGEATVTVGVDNVPPTMVSVLNMIGSYTVTVKFSEQVDPVSATDVNNFLTGYGGPIITNIVQLTDGATVILQLDKPLPGRTPVFVQDVKDLKGNIMSDWKLSTLINLTDADIGTTDASGAFTDPITRGSAFATSASDFEVTAGGSDIWNNADGFHFIYKEVTGDFDVKVRVESIKYVTDAWAKAGLMIRETLTGDSRDMNMVVDPTTGANIWECNYRNVKAGASANWPDEVNRNELAPPYPNAWIRLTRKGNVFTAYRSIDGTTWSQRGQLTFTANAYPSKVYVGMCTTAHNNSGPTTVAKYRNFSITP